MVDAQAIHQALADQLENLAMGGFEHGAAFDPQPAQLVDVEEAPPVDVVRRSAPTGQAVGLLLKQLVQALKAVRLAPVEFAEPVLDGVQHLVRGGAFGQRLLEPRRFGVGVVLIGEGIEAVGQRLEQCIGAQNYRVIARADGETVFVMLNVERTVRGVEMQRQGPGLQGFAVVAAKKWHQQLAFEQRVRRMPLDIEEFAVGA